MNAEGMWELFVRTGNIVFYLMYAELMKEADTDMTA